MTSRATSSKARKSTKEGKAEEEESDKVVKGHAHSTNTHWYKKIDGVWKFAGLSPDIRWFEYDFDKVFESGRHELEKEKS